MTRTNHIQLILLLSFVLFSFKINKNHTREKSSPASSYTSEVLDKWMSMQIKLMSQTPAVFNGPFVRIYSYSSIIAYHSIFPGISNKSAFWFSSERLNSFPTLPQVQLNKKYHWPSSLNAAMAFINRTMFRSASIENKIAIDSLENAIKKTFTKQADDATIDRSAKFGLETAMTIFDWSEMDGYNVPGNSFIIPAGPGQWKPTPPDYARPIPEYWGRLRTMVTGSTDQSDAPAPIPYSEDSLSAFYKQAKEVYDISQTMTPEQKKIALFWKEINPGFTAPGHWLNILRQILQKEKATLDKAAFTYALTGLAMNDAWISSWKTRYVYNVLRPVTFIRDVMGYKDWLSFVPTPPHPEYSSGFAALAGAVCGVLAIVYGDVYQFTDNSYLEAGLGSRSYYSFSAMAREASNSKIYGGIHFRFSVDAGLLQGKTIANNIAGLVLKTEKTNKSIHP